MLVPHEILPPLPSAGVARDLLFIPNRMREDAAQEAWVAHLEGRDPGAAIRTYFRREVLHEDREIAVGLMLD